MQIAARQFRALDQQRFARLSGDFNPMHMDPLVARRTQAGAPVVHGIHALVWALDQLVRAGVPVASVHRIDVQFSKFIHVDCPVILRIVKRTDTFMQADIMVGALPVMTLLLRLGVRKSRGELVVPVGAPTRAAHDGVPEAPCRNEIADMAGWLHPTAPQAEVASAFPLACRALGVARIVGLMQLSYLVGMICPGLHSILAAMTADLVDDGTDAARLGFKVVAVREDIGAVRMQVAGCGLAGMVLAMLRKPPVATPGFDSIVSRVPSGRFAGSSVLIVGGSRGLGATTAKVIVAGGGQATITYVKGRGDAEEVAREINEAFGGDKCRVIQFDVNRDAAGQLGGLSGEIDSLYYFATPHIFQQEYEAFSTQKFDEFVRIYVTGFYNTCRALLAQPRGGHLSVLYPSSVAVESRPRGLTEYAMAKVAGEIICADLVRSLPGLRILVDRLPRTLTDQTATVAQVENAQPLDVLLPLIFQLQAGQPAGP